jgi:hypothetical protein
VGVGSQPCSHELSCTDCSAALPARRGSPQRVSGSRREEPRTLTCYAFQAKADNPIVRCRVFFTKRRGSEATRCAAWHADEPTSPSRGLRRGVRSGWNDHRKAGNK